ncbi:DUF2267 domain-containing protein [Streptomyces sp. NPDC059506]|uniref:DUF2267 domain-containing protein n=1 Tax=Streptomyces thermolineatus TaxID=44033 RepID=A0ABP6A972_9ACTN|nr:MULTISPECIES: DUF2267 domain-containing protein [unclassified Streptomyces]MCZ2527315.1 DUF2267 domain-containing protein [Streptomyces sp. HB2AG]PLW65989.1 DUF2267 domain-containing protein [Streptomyces sp. DJ]QMV22616.1 DUF2267 domain-containing protein [Streptomyces sp. SCUT-3]
MTATHSNGFEHAIHTANIWLKAVADSMETEDRHLANRALRAWLHTLRDRLTVDVAAHFAAQLPELLRGVYYDGWDPSHVPVKYDRQTYVNRFTQESRVDPADVPRIAPAVAEAVRHQVSPGQFETVLDQLPRDVRSLLEPVA